MTSMASGAVPITGAGSPPIMFRATAAIAAVTARTFFDSLRRMRLSVGLAYAGAGKTDTAVTMATITTKVVAVAPEIGLRWVGRVIGSPSRVMGSISIVTPPDADKRERATRAGTDRDAPASPPEGAF